VRPNARGPRLETALLALAVAFEVIACTGQIASEPRLDGGADGTGPADARPGDGTPADAPAGDGPAGPTDAASPDGPVPLDGPAPQDAAQGDGPQADAPVIVCPGATAPECSPGSGSGEGCFDATSCFVTKVQAAVNGVINDHPGWFDRSGSCAIIICDINLFMDDVVARLVAQQLCAIRDPNAPNEEVTVKHDNAFSENFDIVASTGCARTGSAIFTSTCAPAWW
jgi:hypothetical protein